MILPKFAKNCMKLRKFWAVGGGGGDGRGVGAPGTPPKSDTAKKRITAVLFVFSTIINSAQ